MKKIISILLVFILAASTVAFADEALTDAAIEENTITEGDVKVIVNDELIEFDVPPQIIDGRTMVPMRKIFETLGAKIDWVEEAQLIIATFGTSIMSMQIGKESFSVSNVVTGENKTITLDVVPQVIDGRTLVPVRAISESMGMTVEWIEETQTVVIY